MAQFRSTRSGKRLSQPGVIVDVVKGAQYVLVDVGGDVGRQVVGTVGKVGIGAHDVLGEQILDVVGKVGKRSFGDVGKGAHEAHEGVGIVNVGEQVGRGGNGGDDVGEGAHVVSNLLGAQVGTGFCEGVGLGDEGI